MNARTGFLTAMAVGLAVISSVQTASAQRGNPAAFGKYIDQMWDKPPAEGMANLRFLLKKDGKPLAGALSDQTEFHFAAKKPGKQSLQGFNPNSNGRWIHEDLDPGTYDLEITGSGRFEGWKWTKAAVTVRAGESTLFEVEIKS